MVLFTSNRPLDRAENLKAVYDGFDGDKTFIQSNPYRPQPELSDPLYSLRVTDEFPRTSPGKCILIGHGIAGGKLVGLDQPYPFFHRAYAKHLTYVVTTSPAMVPSVAKQSGVTEDKVLPLGMPRTDMYFGKKKGDGGTCPAKRTYLYCPTYRTVEETPMPYIDWVTIDQTLSDDELLLVKPHMMTGNILRGQWRHIREIPSTLPSAPYLIDCDVLITDYSSIMFDAMILGKPVVLFEKLPGYLDTRGMYLKYPEGYTTRYAMNERDLIQLMRWADAPNEAETLCRQTVAGSCDGHSTERVCNLIKEII